MLNLETYVVIAVAVGVILRFIAFLMPSPRPRPPIGPSSKAAPPGRPLLIDR